MFPSLFVPFLTFPKTEGKREPLRESSLSQSESYLSRFRKWVLGEGLQLAFFIGSRPSAEHDIFSM